VDLTKDAAAAISVIIPCHNEAASIRAVLEGCREALGERAHELIVVDDGSEDATATEAMAAGARVIAMPSNGGKGRALHAGVEAAAGPLMLFLDGDGQDDPADIHVLIDALEPDTQMVIGSRFLGTLHPGSIRRLNRIANEGFSAMISLLFGQKITDSQAGFRLIRREPYRALGIAAREYDVETDMLLKAIRAGWRVLEVPVSRYPRSGSETDFKRVRHGILILTTILRERLRPAGPVSPG
jgi:glycosyltransferase involved in cell wall biosynthesis